MYCLHVYITKEFLYIVWTLHIFQCPGIKTVAVDLSQWKEARAAAESVGPIDLLVNNAGTGKSQSFLDIDEETFDRYLVVTMRVLINILKPYSLTLVSIRTWHPKT